MKKKNLISTSQQLYRIPHTCYGCQQMDRYGTRCLKRWCPPLTLCQCQVRISAGTTATLICLALIRIYTQFSNNVLIYISTHYSQPFPIRHLKRNKFSLRLYCWRCRIHLQQQQYTNIHLQQAQSTSVLLLLQMYSTSSTVQS